MVCPSGDTARYSTLKVCPVRVASLVMVGCFQTMIWFWLYPWVLTISFTFFDQDRLQTWLPAGSQKQIEVLCGQHTVGGHGLLAKGSAKRQVSHSSRRILLRPCAEQNAAGSEGTGCHSLGCYTSYMP